MKKFKVLLIALLVAMMALTVAACGGGGKPTVTFALNGGTVVDASGNSITKYELVAGQDYTLPTPTYEGYEFEGWYTAKDFSGDRVTTVASDKSVKVYAKWAKLYAINLELNGGEIEATSLTLKEGANVAAFMQNYVPTKADHQFGQWKVNGAALSSSYTMPGEAITLTAEYKVKYVVKYLLQDINDETSYTADEFELVGYDYAGASVSQTASTITGFEAIDHDGTVSSIVVNADPAQNELKFYYNRKSFNVTFNVIYPDGSKGRNEVMTAKYGQGITDPELEEEGYYLAGWSSQEGVDYVQYQSSFISKKLGKEVQTIAVDGEMNLYPVWRSGLTDMFGSADLLFIDEENEGVVYIYRRGIFFEGTIAGDTNEFTFRDANGDVLFRGRVIDGNQFAYRNAANDGLAASQYLPGQGTGSVQIYFDAYNGLTYSEHQVGGGTVESYGTYTLQQDETYDNDIYVVEFDEGPMAGKTIKIMLVKLQSGFSSILCFVKYEQSHVDLGTLVKFVKYEGGIAHYGEEYNAITLDGYGLRALYNEAYYEYSYDETTRVLTLYGSYGSVAVCGKLVEYEIQGENVLGYMDYNAILDATYVLADGSKLELDGIGEATYKPKGGTPVAGDFTYGYSPIAAGTTDIIIDLEASTGDVYNFRLSLTVDNYGQITDKVLTALPSGYVELYYAHDDIFLVLNDTAPGNASVYGYYNTGLYVYVYKYSSGTYTASDNDLFVYTAQYYYNRDKEITLSDTSINPKFIKSIKFMKIEGFFVNPVFAIFSYVDTVNVEHKVADGIFTTTVDDVNHKLILAQGAGMYYTADSDPVYVVYGNYMEDVYVIQMPNTGEYALIRLYKEIGKFAFLQYMPYKAYFLEKDGYPSETTYIYSDGEGNAFYREVEIDEKTGKETIVKEVKGKFAEEGVAGQTNMGNDLVMFVANDNSMEFKFLMFSRGEERYYTLYNEDFNGTYTGKDGKSKIKVDGYQFGITYTDANGYTYEDLVTYAIEENEDGTFVLVVQIFGQLRYFDFDETGKFTLRGAEEGTHLVYKNNNLQDYYIEFDGYGNAELFRFTGEYDEEDEAIREYIDENATYEISVDGLLTVNYIENGEAKVIEGVFAYLQSGMLTYKMVVILDNSIVGTYVDRNTNEIIELDNANNAVKYDVTGNELHGKYEIVSDELFFVAITGEDGAIDEEKSGLYTYDAENFTITAHSFRARAYYSASLRNFRFTAAGLVVYVDGSTGYYVMEGSNVIFYRRATSDTPETVKVNEYGFYVDDTFGAFRSTKDYNGETYYEVGDYGLRISRDTATENEYPLPLGNGVTAAPGTISFSPTGDGNFTVAVSVGLGGQEVSGTITRKEIETEDGVEVETYIILGYYKLYVEINFAGERNSTYVITKVMYDRTAYSIPYVNSFLYHYYYGYALDDNTWGVINEKFELNTDGTNGEASISFEFFDDQEMTDSKGNNLKAENVTDYEIYSNGTYKVTFIAEDGIEYVLGFTMANAYGLIDYYSITSFSYLLRAKTGNDEFSAEVTILPEEDAGKYGDIRFVKDGERVIFDLFAYTAGVKEGSVAAFSFAKDANDASKIVSGILYNIYFTIENNVITKWSYTETPLTVYYDTMNVSYALVDDEGVIQFVCYGGVIRAYTMGKNVYDEATDTYTVPYSDTSYITVKFVENGEVTNVEVNTIPNDGSIDWDSLGKEDAGEPDER